MAVASSLLLISNWWTIASIKEQQLSQTLNLIYYYVIVNLCKALTKHLWTSTICNTNQFKILVD